MDYVICTVRDSPLSNRLNKIKEVTSVVIVWCPLNSLMSHSFIELLAYDSVYEIVENSSAISVRCQRS